jgi:hypothetical protein
MLSCQAMCGFSSAVGREQRGQVDRWCRHRARARRPGLARIGAVDELESAAAGERLDRRHADVGSHHAIGTVARAQGRHELGADLAERSRDENPLHGARV